MAETVKKATTKKPAAKKVAAEETVGLKAAAEKAPAKKKAAPKKVAEVKASVSDHEIARLAHQFWLERGGFHGGHFEDWTRAERVLRG